LPDIGPVSSKSQRRDIFAPINITEPRGANTSRSEVVAN